MGRFKKGLLFGGLLGAGLTWMATTKKGREVRDQILDHGAQVYTDMAEKLKASGAMDKMTKSTFVKEVRSYVDKYAVDNGLADDVKEMVVKLVGSQWKRIQSELKKRM